MRRRTVFCLLLFFWTAHAVHAASVDEGTLWQRLRAGEVVVLMRHAATTPGIGDPPGFELGKCATQRNLSEAGRRDARAIGAAFRQRGVHPGAVWSSRWCRCLDTARLAFDQAKPEPTLDSMFNDDDAASRAKLRELRAKLAARRETSPLVLVTHDVNIRALTGEYLAQGEMLLAVPRSDRLEVIGRLDARAGVARSAAR
ncbi:histidine phosphatase family protein [Massilia haematophila]|uniref:Histidine phosphatase family protein n=1 Tax=Massilia haematophila TaxID=457923 RepID=A0ABV7PM58_9BURK